MKIRHIRNACMIVECRNQSILVDPCLNPKGSLPPYTLFRSPPRMNPIVDVPAKAKEEIDRITAGLVTHCRRGHFDHLDGSGIRLLAEKGVPVYCVSDDEPYLKRRRITTVPLQRDVKQSFPTGVVTPVPAVHGHGLIGRIMGSGVGYFIESEGEPSLYIAGDTILTDTVRRVLDDLRPDVAVINAGTAALDIGRPILMTLEELLEFMMAAPGMVVAVHLDAFNHCLTTRETLKTAVEGHGLTRKVRIPEDGEVLDF